MNENGPGGKHSRLAKCACDLKRDEERKTEWMNTEVVSICETLKVTTTHGLTELLIEM